MSLLESLKKLRATLDQDILVIPLKFLDAIEKEETPPSVTKPTETATGEQPGVETAPATPQSPEPRKETTLQNTPTTTTSVLPTESNLGGGVTLPPTPSEGVQTSTRALTETEKAEIQTTQEKLAAEAGINISSLHMCDGYLIPPMGTRPEPTNWGTTPTGLQDAYRRGELGGSDSEKVWYARTYGVRWN